MLCSGTTASVSGFVEATSTDNLKCINIPSMMWMVGTYLGFVESHWRTRRARGTTQKAPEQGSAFVQQACVGNPLRDWCTSTWPTFQVCAHRLHKAQNTSCTRTISEGLLSHFSKLMFSLSGGEWSSLKFSKQVLSTTHYVHTMYHSGMILWGGWLLKEISQTITALSHTYVTSLFQSGVDKQLIMQQSGHHSDAIQAYT